jgi:hypothetical protein
LLTAPFLSSPALTAACGSGPINAGQPA